MQYFGRAIGSVSRTWNSLNPSTLSGAIDVVVVKADNGDLHCSAFHIRFGKISLLRPSEKGVDFYMNGEKVPVQMKLGEGGEAFFVFETAADVPQNMLTSPVVSPASSPEVAPDSPSSGSFSGTGQRVGADEEVTFLDINRPASATPAQTPQSTNQTAQSSGSNRSSEGDNDDDKSDGDNEQSTGAGSSDTASHDPTPELDPLSSILRQQHPDRIDEIIRRLSEVNIPSSANDKGEVIVDMTGYKPGGQNTQELEKIVHDILIHDLSDGGDGESPPVSPPGSPPAYDGVPPGSPGFVPGSPGRSRQTHFVKTLRLSSETLKSLNLKPGSNDMKFVVRSNGATVNAQMWLWDLHTPVVISDIDGTITRSDAMGHVMTMLGRDWTHAGVAKLFTDITQNGYNIMYLTSRSAGLADVTRGYLRSIDQDGGYRLPGGPVILSPDRTMAALRREVIMRKPEIFKMACLRDIAKLFNLPDGAMPFYAGFGNRITDALSYRSVGVPSTRIFTINTDSEVRMELLELTGMSSSYILITDLVDHFFPPVVSKSKDASFYTRNPGAVEFTDANFWRAPLVDLTDSESELDDEGSEEVSGDALPEELGDMSIDYEDSNLARFESESDYSSDSDSENEGDDDDDDQFEDSVEPPSTEKASQT